ncbi:receptor-like protein kinase ANXUR2 [Glycine soja]|uniref:Receptor-like protein kinase ANXUR2 n=1 Tax=Glycine soja TaxID=3848 RepID=A0A445FYU6_GLYSO|nr:receptor-like protein kinase ANXUR2 [Glycine soja]RZB53913.1 Receptor-like protein kinase ANXUR2 [Glycine soja]
MLLSKRQVIGRMFLKCFGLYRSSSSQRQYPTIIEELCHKFSLADLRKSTNDFDQNRVIDIRAFGIKIYKGCLQHNDGSDYAVAVKRFKVKDIQAWEVFKSEIELLCQLRHPNIVSLVGFCNDEYEKIIVYEYMSNGSLNERLQGGELSWKKRVEICIGAARGLHYLHAGAKRTIIHRHIKPNNIVLDDNMKPKLTDFGISVLGPRFMSKPKPIKVDSVVGTFGYLAREHLTDHTVTDKTDVYSFGMVLLEVVCGRIYVTTELEKPVEEKIDPNIKGKIAPECWQVFIDITRKCVKYEAHERPTMGEVEVELEHALSLQEQADITNTIIGEYTLLSKTIINLI